jgi:serine protease Do
MNRLPSTAHPLARPPASRRAAEADALEWEELPSLADVLQRYRERGTAAQAAALAWSASAGCTQRIYERTRPLLLQVRTLLKTQDSQSSVGSGFLVDRRRPAGHQLPRRQPVRAAAQAPPAGLRHPRRTTGRAAVAGLRRRARPGLLRAADPAPLAGRGRVPLRPSAEPLPAARASSLGNPLDVGFAVAEGTYNGPVERSFLPTLFFGGSLSPGMSGGPALDDQGRLVGVNVAARRDGEQVSFLVPADAVQALLARGRSAPTHRGAGLARDHTPAAGARGHAGRAFVAQPWRTPGHPRYAIPVPQETFMRCWGRGSAQAVRGLQFERSDCEMDSRVFVSGALRTGTSPCATRPTTAASWARCVLPSAIRQLPATNTWAPTTATAPPPRASSAVRHARRRCR